MLMPYIKGFCIIRRFLLQYTTNKCVYEAFDKHVQVLWHKYNELMSLVWIKSWHLPNNTGLCWSDREEEKEQEETTTGWIQAEWVVMKRWRNGRNREGKNCPDMGISMSSNGRTMTLLHLPLNPIRAPSSAVAGSVIPPSVPAEKKKKERMWSNAHLSGRWSWDPSHMYSMWQTMLLLGVVVSSIAMFVVKMGVMLFHLSTSFYLLLWDVFCKSVIWIFSLRDS